MSNSNEDRANHRIPQVRRPKAPARGKDDWRDMHPSRGAAAAERASAGLGTGQSDPTEWLFGDSFSDVATEAARPY
jgi:hypothetical protein